jgi:hypothetical protein
LRLRISKASCLRPSLIILRTLSSRIETVDCTCSRPRCRGLGLGEGRKTHPLALRLQPSPLILKVEDCLVVGRDGNFVHAGRHGAGADAKAAAAGLRFGGLPTEEILLRENAAHANALLRHPAGSRRREFPHVTSNRIRCNNEADRASAFIFLGIGCGFSRPRDP